MLSVVEARPVRCIDNPSPGVDHVSMTRRLGLWARWMTALLAGGVIAATGGSTPGTAHRAFAQNGHRAPAESTAKVVPVEAGAGWQVVPGVPCRSWLRRTDVYGHLSDVAATSARDAWAVGSCGTLTSPATYVGIVTHWDGRRWSRPASLQRTCSAPDRPETDRGLGLLTCVSRFVSPDDLAASHRLPRLPDGVAPLAYAVQRVPGSSAYWAVGRTHSNYYEQPLIMAMSK
jgi:hypothetical protein